MIIQNRSTVAKACFSLILAVCFFLFVFITHENIAILKSDALLVATLFSVLYLAVLAFFSFQKQVNIMGFAFVSLSIAALMYTRVSILYFDSRDYNIFLSEWLATMRPLSIREALVEKIGDYNLPYLYFLIFISRFKCNDLVLIKFFSCCFDFILAYFFMKTVALKTQKQHWHLLSFVLCLAIPTLILNSSYWGQCDVVYTAFCVAALYFAMKDKGLLSVIMFSLGFVFKLQTIFIVPALFVCLLVKKIKPIHLLSFPIVFLLSSLPSMIAGRSLFSIIEIYINQTNEYPELVLNAPSVFQLFGNVEYENFKYFGMFFTVFVLLCFVYVCYVYREKINEKDMVTIFFISSLLMPYFLPCMHDRYFFIADVLSVLLFLYDRKKWYVPVFTILASFGCYYYYLMGGITLIDQRITALSLLVVLIIVIRDFIKNITAGNEIKAAEVEKTQAEPDL